MLASISSTPRRRRPLLAGLLSLAATLILVVPALAIRVPTDPEPDIACPAEFGSGWITDYATTVETPAGSTDWFVSVDFTIAGEGASCELSLATYELPAPEFSVPQTLFDSDGGTFGPGTHTLTAALPQTGALPGCHSQFDFVFGAAISELTFENRYDQRQIRSRIVSEPCGEAPSEPALDVGVVTPICDGNVPYLHYELEVTGTTATTTTITWLNPAGTSVVLANQPLIGTILWPGAVVDANGMPVDWPGWTQLPNGDWVEGDEWDWVRPSVNVLFQVNPEATATVAYPPSAPDCDGPPREDELGGNPTPTEPTAPPDLPDTSMLAADQDEQRSPILPIAAVAMIASLVVVARANLRLARRAR